MRKVKLHESFLGVSDTVYQKNESESLWPGYWRPEATEDRVTIITHDCSVAYMLIIICQYYYILLNVNNIYTFFLITKDLVI